MTKTSKPPITTSPIAADALAVSSPNAADGAIAAPEFEGLREISFDEVTNLHQQLEVIIRYRTGSAYRNEFDSALASLHQFGIYFDQTKADRAATQIQADTFLKEGANASSDE